MEAFTLEFLVGDAAQVGETEGNNGLTGMKDDGLIALSIEGSGDLSSASGIFGEAWEMCIVGRKAFGS